MRMENASIEFIQFDAKDVIATSTTGGPAGPLAYASGIALSNGEKFFNQNALNNNAFDVLGYANESTITSAIGGSTNLVYYYAITSAGKRAEGKGYELTFDPNDVKKWVPSPPDGYSYFFTNAEVYSWLTQNYQ